MGTILLIEVIHQVARVVSSDKRLCIWELWAQQFRSSCLPKENMTLAKAVHHFKIPYPNRRPRGTWGRWEQCWFIIATEFGIHPYHVVTQRAVDDELLNPWWETILWDGHHQSSNVCLLFKATEICCLWAEEERKGHSDNGFGSWGIFYLSVLGPLWARTRQSEMSGSVTRWPLLVQIFSN